MTRALVQITRSGVRLAVDAELDAAARAFARERKLHLPRFFAPELLDVLLARLSVATFKTRIARLVHPPAVDLKLDDARLQGSLRWLLSDPELFRGMARLARIERPTYFNGSVYRIQSGSGHRDSWHNDLDGRRQVAITVNLSEEPFEGGELQMRETASQVPLWTFANTGRGDALLFAIDPSLEHCIAPMRGAVAKTALAGWFCR
jgi:hypothetical protein